MVNLPLPESLDKECQKAARTLRSFRMPEINQGLDSLIPVDVIEKAKGLVIMTVLKGGFLFSGRIGFGLVVAKLPNGAWSAPSAIGTGSFGAGLQIGAELTDFVIILNHDRAVDAFKLGGNVAVGGNLSVAAGPVGRNAEASGMATIAAIYSYSQTKGLFAGISIEGTVFVERSDANEAFYGRKVTARELLEGVIAPPREAKSLYDAIKLREAAAHDDRVPLYLQQNAPAARPPPVSSAPAGRPASVAGRPASVATPPLSSSSFPATASSSRPIQSPASTPALPSRPKPRAKAIYNFVAQQPGDLGFNVGDIIEITEKTGSQNDWWKGTLNGRSGSFPANYIELL